METALNRGIGDINATLASITNQVAALNTQTLTTDFLDNTYFIISAAINGGAMGTAISEVKHPGVFQIASSASANSGARAITHSNSIRLSGGEKTTIIFKTPANLTGVTAVMGFCDTLDAIAWADCACIKINGTTLTGETESNNAGSTTGTSYTVAVDTWYRVVIEVNADATSVSFKLYADDSDTLLWSNTLTTNIPTAAGRELHYVITAIMASPTGTTVLLLIDYLNIQFTNSRRVV